ncbi:YhdP family phospholipid transporter [Thiothrix fructosivorans]|uniref:YhdP central domain-containing protein n=1 Tax=Thiothrix fructosivorans TaxID=111770 RepID=A0A8B0SGR3_9GAMM|nr:DUF3971 domain-containing protein [Thiothrix fructosivorans]MBO0615202.1 hypothetical protein [Thiothrix fructosivorans]QTX09989.1 hypothetical protein J1836_015475 [Thiothrix fructosivorans]
MYFSRRQGGFVLRLTYLLLTFFFHWAIFLVALFGLAQLWLPMVNDYKGILESELSDFVGNQINIGQIRVDSDGDGLLWVLENLQLTEPSGQSPIQIRQLALTVDWRESLRTLRLQPAEIKLEGVEFILRQQANALPDIQGLRFPLPGQKNTVLNIERQSPIRISINSGFVHWMDETNHRSLALSDLQFMGEILPNEITLQADALFPPAIGETLGVDAVLHQAPAPDGKPQWEGDLHTRTQIFNLAALPSPVLKSYGVTAGGLKLDATISAVAGKPLQVSGEGEVTHLSWSGNADVPALQGVNATFAANNAGGKVKVNISDSSLQYPKWFEKPLRVDTLAADLNWTVQPDGWHWQLARLNAKNPDITLQGSGKFDLPHQQPPNIDLAMTFATQRTVDNVRDYIPALLPDHTEQWLKTAIVQGYVPKGEFVLRGNPADFPFQHKAGVFDIRFDIENGVLAYLPEWPQAEAVNGELHFHNADMNATVRSATIMDLDVRGGTVAIPNMHTKDNHLLLDLQTQGDLQAHMNYLRDAPIGRSLRDFMQVARFAGDSDLRLKLDVPLKKSTLDAQGVAVDGLVSLHGNRFAIPDYDQSFTQLNGQVHFDQYGVNVENATGEYRQQPLKLSAKTDKAHGIIRVGLQQQQSPSVFLPESLASLKPYVHGKTTVETLLELPAFNAAKDKALSSLSIQSRSQLAGVAIDLPPPFGKAAETARDLQVDVDLPFDSNQPWQVDVDMGKYLSVKARLPHKGKQPTAIGVSVGGTAVTLPESGILVGGELEELDLLAWQGFGAAMSGGAPDAATPPSVIANLGVSNLMLGAQSLGKASINVEQGDILKAHVRAERLQANVYLPRKKWANGRVNIDFNHIDLDKFSASLPKRSTGKAGSLSPADFPSLRVTCRDCQKDDFPIEQLTLNLNKVRNDLQMDTFELRNSLLTLSATQGRWYSTAASSSQTELTVTASIPEPGKLLSKPDSEAGLQGGALQATANLHWDGAPFNFALPTVKGDIQVRFGKGSLSEVDPGLGRLLGLLDAQRLPERLTLDFRDMMAKGVAFDAITGNFNLEQGILTTHDTIIEAAAMNAGVKGSVNLVRKTLDQTLIVIPNLRSTLPVVGAAVGGIGGGAAMLLLNSLTEKTAAQQLQTAGGLRYRVTGAWEKPEIVELKLPFKKTDVDVLTH